MSELFLSSSGKTNMFVLKQRKHTAGNFLTLFSLFGSGERVDTTRAVVKLFSDRQLLRTTELSLCFCVFVFVFDFVFVFFFVFVFAFVFVSLRVKSTRAVVKLFCSDVQLLHTAVFVSLSTTANRYQTGN